MDNLLQQLLEGIKDHPYWTIMAITLVESRYTSVVVGALIAKGYDINPVVAYTIFAGMCIAGDLLFYYAGRMGNILGRFLIKKSWQSKLDQLNGERKDSKLPSLLFSAKIVGVAKPVIVAAGIVKMDMATFCRVTIPCTMVLYIISMVIGYFFGHLIF